jgi:hypothetical protein
MPHHPEGRRYWAMGRDPNQNQTPDLFSTGADLSANKASHEVPGRTSRRTALPEDLPKAIRYLSDRELDWLLRTAIEEAKRRGRLVPMGMVRPTNMPTVSPDPAPKRTEPLGRPTRQRQTELAPTSLTRGQVNAVRAAFKAGVTPSRIARQFGLSKSDVRKALVSDEPER